MRRVLYPVMSQLPPVAAKLAEAQAQLDKYRETLERVYGDKRRSHAVVSLGRERSVGNDKNNVYYLDKYRSFSLISKVNGASETSFIFKLCVVPLIIIEGISKILLA